MPQSGTDEQLRRRRRQQLTSFDFTDRLTQLYRNIRSIRYIYSKYSCLIRAKHIIEQGLLIYLSRRIPRASESPTELSTLLHGAEFHRPTKTSNFIRSLVFKRREREKKRSEKKSSWRSWDSALLYPRRARYGESAAECQSWQIYIVIGEISLIVLDYFPLAI